MKQQNYFRLFAEKISGASPPPDTSDQDWQALSSRLERHENFRRSLPTRWLAGLTLLLFLTNGFWFWQWRQATSAGQTAARIDQPDSPPAAAARDTIFQKTVVHQYDTIYRTVVVQQQAAQKQPFSEKIKAGGGLSLAEKSQGRMAPGADMQGENSSAQPIENLPGNAASLSQYLPAAASESSENPAEAAGRFAQNLPETSAQPSQNLPGGAAGFLQNQPGGAAIFPENQSVDSSVQARASEEIVISPGDQPPLALPVAGLQPLAFPGGKMLPVALPATAVLPAKKKRRVAQQFIPRSFAAGLSGGTYLPFVKDFDEKSGYLFGVSGEIGFANRLSLSLEGAHGRVNFKGSQHDPALGLPPLQPPGDDFELEYFETHDGGIPLWQASVGIRYRLATGKRFSSYFGAGYLAQWRGAHEFEMEYVHLPSGMKTSLHVDMPASVSPTSYARFELGAGWRFFEKWQVRAGLDFDLKMEREQAGLPRYLGLGAAVLREF